MSADPGIPERNRLLAALDREGFTGVYLAVGELHRLFQEAPELADADAADALGGLMLTNRFTRERQAFFLHRAAAEILVSLLAGPEARDGKPAPPAAGRILEILDTVLETTQGPPHRAAAEALGALPLGITGPDLPETPMGGEPVVSWRTLLDEAGFMASPAPSVAGRSLILPKPGTEEVLMVKLARPEDPPESLCRESAWADVIGSRLHRFRGRFDIPRPQPILGSRLFRLSRLPEPRAAAITRHPAGFAAAFWIHREYFAYPNSHHPDQALPEPRFLDTLRRNAMLLGQLTGMGVLHTAPIPLFHNRIQRNRRADRGIYEWHRGGRLDRWLFSCRYPNFGMTGVRDFEHFSSLNGSVRGLYRAIGTQILGLLLVAASYFRHRQPDRFGFEPDGRPVDVRHLFDPALLEALVRGVFGGFYEGFVGREYRGGRRLRVRRLVDRMIEEMGIDRHMEEILRTADQEAMSQESFQEHLLSRGVDPAEIRGFRKGTRDIVLHTGPHLGGFNQRISLPELIHFLETAAALCIAHRFAAAGRLSAGSG